MPVNVSRGLTTTYSPHPPPLTHTSQATIITMWRGLVWRLAPIATIAALLVPTSWAQIEINNATNVPVAAGATITYQDKIFAGLVYVFP